MASKQFSVGVVGATGAVGMEVVNVLKDRNFPVSSIALYASARSAGKTLQTKFGPLEIALFSVEAARAHDVVFMAVSGSFATENAPKIAAEPGGALVIDNSSAFRYDPDIPLVIPEINSGAIGSSRLIANPNCTTAIAAMALWPLHRRYGIRKLIVSTYQASSGAGAEGMAELRSGTAEALKAEAEAAAAAGDAGNPGSGAGSAKAVASTTHAVFAHPLPFNVIPHIDVFKPNGYTKEEMKVCWETRKIFGVPDLPVSCTAVRIPTFRAHAESIVIETARPVTVEGARACIDAAPGVQLVDDPEACRYPMPLTATEKHDVEAGRIRRSLVFGDRGLELFVCGDQILRGAALNAVLIAEAALLAGPGTGAGAGAGAAEAPAAAASDGDDAQQKNRVIDALLQQVEMLKAENARLKA